MLRFHPPRFNDVALLRAIEPSRFLAFLQRFDHYLYSQGFEIPEEPDLSDAQLVTVHGSRRFGADFPAILAVTALTR